MIHTKLSTKDGDYYGVGINCFKDSVLLLLGDTYEQVGVRLTKEEVDQIVEKLLLNKKKIIENEENKN